MPLRRVQHIDLYSNLEARIQYLHSFLDFTSSDIDALTSGSRYIKALIPSVVDAFYRKLLQYDNTSRTLAARSTSYQGSLDKNVEENSPQVQYRKLFLQGYLQKITSDPSKLDFWEYLDKVAMMHAGLDGRHQLNVEFIHLGAALGYIQGLLTEGILAYPRLKSERKLALVKAVGKIIWIQNDLFAKWRLHGDEAFKSTGTEPEIEQEGFLHGKQVINLADPHISDPETPIEESSCPFSPLVAKLERASMTDYPPGHPAIPEE